jgi:hypothetical protein
MSEYSYVKYKLKFKLYKDAELVDKNILNEAYKSLGNLILDVLDKKHKSFYKNGILTLQTPIIDKGTCKFIDDECDSISSSDYCQCLIITTDYPLENIIDFYGLKILSKVL